MTSWSGGSSGQPPLYHNNIIYAMTFYFQRIVKFLPCRCAKSRKYHTDFHDFFENSSKILRHLYHIGYEFTKISDEYTILRTMFMNDGTEWYSFKDMNLVY